MSRPRFKLLACVAVVVALITMGFALSLWAQEAAPAQVGTSNVAIKGTRINVGPGKLRTAIELQAAAQQEALHGPQFPIGEGVPFRPTVDPATYRQLKAQAAAAPAAAREAPAVLAPPAAIGSFEGVNMNEAGLWYPPDTIGAIGRNHFIETVNSFVSIYKRTNFGIKLTMSLNSLVGYFTQPLFDPRVVYDWGYDRFIITAPAFPENANMMRFFVAISRTSDPFGDWWVYSINATLGVAGGFFDYPMIGWDNDTLMVTANFFVNNVYRDTKLLLWAKSAIYNGKGLVVPFYSGLKGTLAPPIVLDRNPHTYLLAAVPGDNKVWLYDLVSSSRVFPSLFVSTIPVPAYTVPPDAVQPGTAARLDTLDARFVNCGTQVGNSLWQVHTIVSGGLPTPKWYEFNPVTKTITQSGFFFKSATSHDFNASIAANSIKDVFVTWSATDPPAGNNVNGNAQVRFSGRVAADPAGVIPAGAVLAGGTSATFWTLTRWGDYSSVSLDPLNFRRAWICNEKILSNQRWGSRIGQIGY